MLNFSREPVKINEFKIDTSMTCTINLQNIDIYMVCV